LLLEKEMKGTAMLLHFLLSSDAHFLHCIEASEPRNKVFILNVGFFFQMLGLFCKIELISVKFMGSKRIEHD